MTYYQLRQDGFQCNHGQFAEHEKLCVLTGVADRRNAINATQMRLTCLYLTVHRSQIYPTEHVYVKYNKIGRHNSMSM